MTDGTLSPGLIPLAEAARRAGYANLDSLRGAIHRGRLRAEKHGRNWFTRDEWVAEYQASRPEWAVRGAEAAQRGRSDRRSDDGYHRA